MNLKSIKRITDFDAAGRRVLIRVDLDVPLENGEVSDDSLIRAVLPTVEHLLSRDARVLLMGHLGNPKGKMTPSLSMEPVARRLAELLPGGEVFLTDSCVGDGAKRVALDLRDAEVGVLENLSFHCGEASDDEKLARELASFADIYINESPRTLNLNIASVASVPRYVSKRACGFMVEKELEALSRITGKVERPFVAVLGGSGFSSKLPLLQYFLEHADTVIVGGAAAHTFVAAQGCSLGTSTVEESRFASARDLAAKAKSCGGRLVLPIDFVVAKSSADEDFDEAPAEAVPRDAAVFDIGSNTRSLFKDAISRAATIFWNGPMGFFENERFSAGTVSVARSIAGSSAFSMVGGDNSAFAVVKSGLEKGFNHVSSGGRSSLEFLEGKVLPGIGALEGSGKTGK